MINRLATEPWTLIIVCHDVAFFTTRSHGVLFAVKYERLEPAVTKGADPEGRIRT